MEFFNFLNEINYDWANFFVYLNVYEWNVIHLAWFIRNTDNSWYLF